MEVTKKTSVQGSFLLPIALQTLKTPWKSISCELGDKAVHDIAPLLVLMRYRLVKIIGEIPDNEILKYSRTVNIENNMDECPTIKRWLELQGTCSDYLFYRIYSQESKESALLEIERLIYCAAKAWEDRDELIAKILVIVLGGFPTNKLINELSEEVVDFFNALSEVVFDKETIQERIDRDYQTIDLGVLLRGVRTANQALKHTPIDPEEILERKEFDRSPENYLEHCQMIIQMIRGFQGKIGTFDAPKMDDKTESLEAWCKEPKFDSKQLCDFIYSRHLQFLNEK